MQPTIFHKMAGICSNNSYNTKLFINIISYLFWAHGGIITFITSGQIPDEVSDNSSSDVSNGYLTLEQLEQFGFYIGVTDEERKSNLKELNRILKKHEINAPERVAGFMGQVKVEKYPSIQRFCADAGYRGTFISDVKTQFKREVNISARIKPHCWEKLSWRWFVERTFAWANHSRRLSKDYEISLQSAASIFQLSHIFVLLHRL